MSEFKKTMFEKYRVVKRKTLLGIKPKGRDEKEMFRLKEKIDRCLANLEEPYSTIFTRAFLDNENKIWWCSIYSTATYYRYLKQASEKFFSLFYRGNL